MSAIDDLLTFVEGRDLTVSFDSDLVADEHSPLRWFAATNAPTWPHDHANPLERMESGASIYEAAAKLTRTLREADATSRAKGDTP